MFALQSDVEQLSETVISLSEECTDADWSWLCFEAAGPASAADEVVGAAPTQLEPSNELIRFDHEYYRTAPPPDDDVTVCSDEEVVCEVEVSSEEQPTDDPDSAVLPSDSDIDLSVLGDQELWDSLEQIIEADQLLGLCNMPPSIIPTTAETSCLPAEFSTNNQELSKLVENIKTLPIPNGDGFAVNSPLGDVDAFSMEPWSSESPRNDFEASSSGIASPFSDDLVDTEDYGFHWEESFTELFPALV